MPRDCVPRPSMPFAPGEKMLHADTGGHARVPAFEAFELDSAKRLFTRHHVGDGWVGASATPPECPWSGADVGRQVLAGEGGAGGDKVRGCALEDDAAAVVTGAGAEVDDPIGVRHHRLVVLDDDD
jgi:hypothetical protein